MRGRRAAPPRSPCRMTVAPPFSIEASSASGRAKAMLDPTVSLKRNVSSNTVATAWRRSVSATSRTSMPSMLMRPPSTS